MEAIIREGALRALQSSESTCDVILSCQGHRFMAHKIILSIASPILRVSLLFFIINYFNKYSHYINQLVQKRYRNFIHASRMAHSNVSYLIALV